MIYKILHDLCPDNLRHKFIERSIISEYGTRNRRDLQIPKIRLEYAKRSFYFSPVSKTGMMFLAASENKSHSLVSQEI